MSDRTGAVISEQTFGETVADAYGVPFCLAADGKWYRADASDPLLSRGDMALCVEPSVVADGEGRLLKYGWIRRTGWTWILGQPVYFGATPGTLTQTKPTGNTIRYAGYPAAADALWFSPTDPVLAEYLSLDLPTGTQGDLLAHNGVAWAPLAPGTEGQVLQTGGPGADPAWADLPDGMYRNAIINGNFDIWQRGTSFQNINGLKFTADRFSAFAVAPGTVMSVSRRQFAAGQTEVPGNPAYYANINISAPSPEPGGFNTVIEDVRTFAGQTVTLSFYARSSDNPVITTECLQQFGINGSADVGFTVGSVYLTPDWRQITFTVSIPDISGKTVGDNSSLAFQVLRIHGVCNIDIAQVQLNIGDKPLPFSPRPYAEELALCQRYFISLRGGSQDIFATMGTGVVYSSTVAWVVCPIPTSMRSVPTVISRGNLKLMEPAYITNPTLSVLYSTSTAVTLQADITGCTPGNACILAADGDLAGDIWFSAEL